MSVLDKTIFFSAIEHPNISETAKFSTIITLWNKENIALVANFVLQGI